MLRAIDEEEQVIETGGELLELDTNVEALSILSAIKKISIFALPFTLTRIAVAASVIGNGVVMVKLGKEAAASGAVSMTIFYAIMGPACGALLATGISVANHHGLATELQRNNDSLSANEQFRKIGDLARQGLLFGVLLAVPSLGIMFGTAPFLRDWNTGIDCETRQ